mgnify:CR=1 FL=1
MTIYVNSLLSAAAADVTGKPTPTRTWQWLRNGTAISGANSSTYTVVEADLAANLSVSQIETNLGGIDTATSTALGPVSTFGVNSLFANDEEGAWYDPSDLSTLFQDSAGTTPVTTAGQPVGLMLDKSGRDNHATQATAAARPTYQTGAGLHWLAFDGVDDVLRVDGTSSKDWTIAAGITTLGAVNTSAPMYSAYTAGSNRVIISPNDGAAGSGGFRLFENTGNLISEDGPDLTGTAVVYAIRSVTLDHSARRNGVSVGTSNDSRDVDFFPAAIGSYPQASNHGESNIFGLVVVEGAVAALSDLEQYLATKSGVTL